MAAPNLVQGHRSLMERHDLDLGLTTAMLEYQRQLCEQRTDMSGAAANHFKLVGAQEFLHVLKTLTEVPKILARDPVGNLSHNS